MLQQYFVSKSSVLCNTLPPFSSHCQIFFIFESECHQDLCGLAFSIFPPYFLNKLLPIGGREVADRMKTWTVKTRESQLNTYSVCGLRERNMK